MSDIATLTSKSQITVPRAVREALGLVPGDQIRFVPAWQGFRLVVIKGGIESMCGAMPSPDGKPVSIEQMNRDIAKMGTRREKRGSSVPREQRRSSIPRERRR
jgi:antitoxin PrlF